MNFNLCSSVILTSMAVRTSSMIEDSNLLSLPGVVSGKAERQMKEKSIDETLSSP